MALISRSTVYKAQESIAAGASHALPSGIDGHVIVNAEDEEGALFAVESSGNVLKISGTTNTDDADTASMLCVYNNAGVPTVKNNLAATKTVTIRLEGV